MRKILQTVALLLVVWTFLTPVIEFFDRWDPPGPWDDTELAVFSLILGLALVLLLARLVASLARLAGFRSLVHVLQDCDRLTGELRRFFGAVVPSISPPLRI